MRQLMFLFMTFVLGSAPLTAQTVVADVRADGFESRELRPVEADGDASTQEWLAQPAFNTRGPYQVVAIGSGGTLCRGVEFTPSPDWSAAVVEVRRLGRADVLVVRQVRFGAVGILGDLRVVALDRPPCG